MKFLEEIFIGSKFDAKGFKQAETALGKLANTTKKLAGAAGIAYGAAAITAYGKAAVKAFAQDEAAALRLNRAVENLGIGFANPAIADYISKLEKSAAIADDILRPAFQGLLTTTGSLTQSQKLLNEAITISRASGIDLATVTEDLGKGYVGITKGLTKYNTGLTRAELQTKSFNEILGVILKRSAGAAEDYLDTTAYKFDVLSVATNNASEIIGGGLVDAFALVGGGQDASDAAAVIESIATALAKVTVQSGRTIGVIPTLIQNLKNLPKQIFEGFAGKQLGVNIIPPAKKEEVKLTLTEKKQQELLAKLEKESLRREKERLALKNKQNTADKLKLATAKAEAALGKGETVFDMDKIQNAAALINQAQLLGKATDAAAVLQVASDTARLNIKKAIFALDDAIASKDEAAIIAATKKLNAELAIFTALTGQNTQMAAIESILKGLAPKDLVNQKNLDDAISKIREMLALLARVVMPTITIPAGAAAAEVLGNNNNAAANAAAAAAAAAAALLAAQQSAAAEAARRAAAAAAAEAARRAAEEAAGRFRLPADIVGEVIDPIAAGSDINAILEYADAAAARADAIAELLDSNNAATMAVLTQNALSNRQYGFQSFQSAEAAFAQPSNGSVGGGIGARDRDFNITVNTGVGDPNAIAEAIANVLRNAVDRGSLDGLLIA